MTTTTRPFPEFVQHCLDLLASAGPCAAKRMFGGWGISTDGLTFAIIADLGDGERLWLKADATTLPTFAAAGCRPFVYTAKGKPMTLSYRAAPDDAMESSGLMRPWAQLALDAAVRAQAAKTRAPRPKRVSKKIAGNPYTKSARAQKDSNNDTAHPHPLPAIRRV